MFHAQWRNTARTDTPFTYMRLSIPNIPPSILSNAALRNVPSVQPAEAVQRIASFLSSGTAALLTGAGVSVDSGVKAYRGKDGRYINPDYKYARLPLRFVLRNCRLHCRRLSSDRFSWALVCSPSFPCLVNRACLCSTRSSSKIAHEDTPFGELPFLRFRFTNLSISPISVNDTGECL